jgi:methionyl-tRNA synthetase
MSRDKLVTNALPYANGPLHLGHMLGMIQADTWVRFQRMRGQRCYFFCGDDAHGTPIMLKAREQGKTNEALIGEIYASHLKDVHGFGINFDCYHTTHSPENEALASSIFLKLQSKGYIDKRIITQAYDPKENMFLPDRYVKGECPKCGAADQYGDSCEVCGATYSPLDLKNPVSAISGATPISKESEHFFFKLTSFEKELKEWMKSGTLQKEVANKLKEWFEAGLHDWDITRDAPYFGFLIPGETDKYFYVWMDAPIGYFSSMMHFAKNHAEFNFDEMVRHGKADLYHFVGKDIIYFHALFWPAMLSGAEMIKPTGIFTSGFVTVNGQKMSKSRGTFIEAQAYLSQFSPTYLRYYYCAKSSAAVDDIDFEGNDFAARVNSDLVGKYVNIASRCAPFMKSHFNNTLGTEYDERLIKMLTVESETIADFYNTREYGKAAREIMRLADEVNAYIATEKPWEVAKTDDKAKLLLICTTAMNAFRLLSMYLHPMVPELTAKAAAFLNTDFKTWHTTLLLNHTIHDYAPMIGRIDLNEVLKMTDTPKPENKPVEITAPAATTAPVVDTNEIAIEDFMKIDLRIAKIVEAESVPEADKLVRLTLDLGPMGKRQVFAGIKSAYSPEQLLGQLTVMVSNLKPRKMRFGMSEGMVLAASGEEGPGIYILTPHEGAQPGMRVK